MKKTYKQRKAEAGPIPLWYKVLSLIISLIGGMVIAGIMWKTWPMVEPWMVK